MELVIRNVNEAFYYGVKFFCNRPTLSVEPRGKKTLEWPEPWITYYEQPQERVLFSAARDANPFLHLFESLWMLAGRDDLKFMQSLSKRFEQYSDDGKILQGAYGARWKTQLTKVIEILKEDKDSRRAVLTMWNILDLGTNSKDIPCNTHVYFKIRSNKLRMTICCRSNDMIWGAYGANAVHFSMLQEYIADKLGVAPGPMIQISDSMHVYLEGDEGKVWARCAAEEYSTAPIDPYKAGEVAPLALGARKRAWDDDLKLFFEQFDTIGPKPIGSTIWKSEWWRAVAAPMWNAFVTRGMNGVKWINEVEAPDWNHAGREWLERRAK